MLSWNVRSFASACPNYTASLLPKGFGATRAFVAVLLTLARRCQVALDVNRDSARDRLLKPYKKLLLKAHPDTGGRKEHAQKLQAAREAWEIALKVSGPKGGRTSLWGGLAR